MRKIFSTLLLTVICFIAFGETTFAAENVDETTTETDALLSEKDDIGIKLDSVSFAITSDGKVRFIDEEELDVITSVFSDTVAGTFNYYYNGLNSLKQPRYSVVLKIFSETNLKSSVLSTKAQGVSDWHDNNAQPI
ncbi:MAG: hypothetical protein GX995_03455 [Clostridiales bacterium]|nr:hypothetical protein [Clostridiales bacterium]